MSGDSLFRSAHPWMVSLHGGHSADYCDHAHSTLYEMLGAAAAKGMVVFGVTEHAPRVEARFLYPEEIEMGWDLAKVIGNFERYAEAIGPLAEIFRDRLTVLRAFEIEVVPQDRYIDVMLGYRKRYNFDYVVGSVHYVGETLIDYTAAVFEEAMKTEGGLEPLAVRYYNSVTRMVNDIKPEVVGHLDLIRKFGRRYGPVDTPPIRRAAEKTLEAIREHNGILDINTAGYRKGLDGPYVAPWLLERAQTLGIEVCFGDDSHSVSEVGAGIFEAREYLLAHGIDHITVLNRGKRTMLRQQVPLED
jgi:histidinol-phosphatase (PHP family)